MNTEDMKEVARVREALEANEASAQELFTAIQLCQKNIESLLAHPLIRNFYASMDKLSDGAWTEFLENSKPH
jgi:hypothetical protein